MNLDVVFGLQMSGQMIHFVLEMIRPDIVRAGGVFIVRVVEIIRQRDLESIDWPSPRSPCETIVIDGGDKLKRANVLLSVHIKESRPL